MLSLLSYHFNTVPVLEFLFGDEGDVDDDVHDDGDIDFDAHLYLCIFLSNSSWNAAWK